MLSFLQFLYESLADTTAPQTPGVFSAGSSWYNSKTGQITPIEGHSNYDPQTGKQTRGANGLTDAAYHAGFVVKNLDHFGITPEELHSSILQFENPRHPQMGTPEEREHLARKRVDELRTGYRDQHPGVESLVMGRGWVRIVRSPLSVFAEGKAPGLLALAKHVYHNQPKITSLIMDVHGANQTYGHLDPSIQGLAHSLKGRDDILDFIERRGAPHRSYSRIVRVRGDNPS